MDPKKRNHTRVLLQEIHASPEKGIYITKKDAMQISLWGIIFFICLAILAVFPQKK